MKAVTRYIINIVIQHLLIICSMEPQSCARAAQQYCLVHQKSQKEAVILNYCFCECSINGATFLEET
jgi:hypothetical protein